MSCVVCIARDLWSFDHQYRKAPVLAEFLQIDGLQIAFKTFGHRQSADRSPAIRQGRRIETKSFSDHLCPQGGFAQITSSADNGSRHDKA